MLEFKNPIPVTTALGKGYAIYCTNSGTFENDVWTVVICSTGNVRHFQTNQIRIHKNGTFEIKADES